MCEWRPNKQQIVKFVQPTLQISREKRKWTYSDVQMTVVNGCVSVVFLYATSENVYLDSTLCVQFAIYPRSEYWGTMKLYVESAQCVIWKEVGFGILVIGAVNFVFVNELRTLSQENWCNPQKSNQQTCHKSLQA